jgi:hypothetical protein
LSEIKTLRGFFIASILLIYLLISLYFSKHFFFNPIINGVDVSLKAHEDIDEIIRSYAKDYKLQLVERNGKIEEIIGPDIGMEYNEKNSIDKVYPWRNSFKWINSLLKYQNYYVVATEIVRYASKLCKRSGTWIKMVKLFCG